MLKVLPRIEGDIDKLGNSAANGTVLTQLLTVLDEEFSLFKDNAADGKAERPDLFQISISSKVLTTDCRCKAKINWMQHRLETTGFTSYWP